MSVSRNIVAVLNEDVVSTAYVFDKSKRMLWLDLMDHMDIHPSELEKVRWAREIRDVQNNVPSWIELVLSSSLTPSGRRFRSLFAPLERKRLSKGVILEQIPFMPYIKSNAGLQKRAESYVAYLHMLHDYMPYIETFQDLQATNNPIYGWRKKAILNGCLLYRKLLDAGLVQKGEYISLNKMFPARKDMLALIGRYLDGSEMNPPEQAEYIKNMVSKYAARQQEQINKKTKVAQTEEFAQKGEEQKAVKAKGKKHKEQHVFARFMHHLKNEFQPVLTLFATWHKKVKSKGRGDSEITDMMNNNPELALSFYKRLSW